jgi:hypothetical protein
MARADARATLQAGAVAAAFSTQETAFLRIGKCSGSSGMGAEAGQRGDGHRGMELEKTIAYAIVL